MPDTEKLDALMRLAGTVAHELNNIFTAVNGNLSLLEMTLETASPNAQVVSDVFKTTRRGIELSEKLQAFAGRQKLLRTRLDMNEVTASAVGGLKRSVLRDIDVELALAPHNCPVATDEEKLRHVIEELARNAAAAMDHRGWVIFATGRQSLAAGQAGILPPGEYAFISVKDTGRGMSPEVARRALDPLFSTKPGHHGWGLARCAGFVRQCGGNIVLASVPGKGTAATVYLPLVQG